MALLIRDLIKKVLPGIVLKKIKSQNEKKQYKLWLEKGSEGSPPHLYKQSVISEYQKKFGCNVLIETGTYLGDMVEAQKGNFKKIISIELGMDLFKIAKKRFSGDKNVTIIQGDSGKVLSQVLSSLNEPAIFWLDGHYSAGITAKGEKECPIFEELEAIFSNMMYNHVLLIDDAKCFVGENDYPTIKELTEYIKQKNKFYQVEVKHDVLRFTNASGS